MAILSRPDERITMSALVVALAGLLSVGVVSAQTPAAAASVQERGPQALSPEAIQSSIDALGNVDAAANSAAFDRRMNAARALRRAPADAVTPALIQAVDQMA